VRDPARSRREAAEVLDDRPSLQVRHDAHERQARQQTEEEAVTRARICGVNQGLRVSTSNLTAVSPGSDGAANAR